MTIDHYFECKVCHGSNSSFNSFPSMAQSHLIPENMAGTFQENSEKRVLPIRSRSFRDAGEIDRERIRQRPPVHLRSKLRNDSPYNSKEIEIKVPYREEYMKRRGSLPSSSTPNLHQLSNEDLQDNSKDRLPTVRRVRSFKTTSKGIVNRGDSFRKRGDRNTSTERIRYAYTPSPRPNRRVPLEVQVEKTRDVAPEVSYFKVVVLGSTGVGKTAITHQFMTSEYVAFDNSIDQDDANAVVPVQLNGEESTLEFLDSREYEINLENVQADAYLVVFSITHRDTFDVALDLLSELRVDLGTDRPIVLVGNKLDLVRKRKVRTEDAQESASMYEAMYMEVSAGINHNIDELLVGILGLIKHRLDPSLPHPTLRVGRKNGSKASKLPVKGPFNFFSRMFQFAKEKLTTSRKKK